MEHFEHNREQYLQKVLEQVRYRPARKPLRQELEGHITDQKEVLLAQGFSPDEAERQAVQSMGDPVQVGLQLNQVHRPRKNLMLLLSLFVPAAVGVGLQLLLVQIGGNAPEAFFRYLFSLGAGVAVFVLCYFCDYTLLRQYAFVLYGALLVGGFLVVFRVPLGGGSPARQIVLAAVPLLGGVIAREEKRGWRGLLLSAGCLWAALLLASLMPWVLGVAAVAVAGTVMLAMASLTNWFGTSKWGALAVSAGPFLFLSGLVLAPQNNFWRRLSLLLHPEQDPKGYGYLAIQARNMLTQAHQVGDGSAGLVMEPEILLPGWNGELMLTWAASRLGLIWMLLLALLLVGAVACLGWFAGRISQKQAKMTAIGITVLLGTEIFVALLANLSFISFSASLPFFQGGFFNQAVHFGLLGIFCSLYRTERLVAMREIRCPAEK